MPILTTIPEGWQDYELLDSGNGRRLERFGPHLVVRPDPNVLWRPERPDRWKADATFVGAKEGWHLDSPALAEGWPLRWRSLTLKVAPTPFRHMGVFPEQAANWQWLQERIIPEALAGRRPRVLNLFAYTGAASVAAAKAGAFVTHVDASKGSIAWAAENAQLSGLPDDAIRWIQDDVAKFLRREARRGSRYDLILLDPPVFGRGPKGEIFRLEERLSELLELCADLLAEKPLGFLMNFYATALYPEAVQRLAEQRLGCELSLHSLCLEESWSKRQLSTGFFLRS